MKTFGIRILDKVNHVVSVKLQDILEEITDGEFFYWSILFFDGMGHLKNGKSIAGFAKEALQSERGILTSWEELNSLADSLEQIFDILIIGCKDVNNIARYQDDKEMYETCDIVINMFDSSFWEVFSKDESLIHRLAAKFKDVKFITDYSFIQ